MMNDTDKSDAGGKNADNLNEILRLQAVALARMSERMSDPPPGVGRALPPPADMGQGHLPVLAGDPSVSDESLPVLNTFKKFLEAERQRARRRAIGVSAVLGAVVLVALAVVVWVGRERVRELRGGIGVANARMDETRRKAEEDLTRASRSAAAQTSAMQQDLRRGVLTSHLLLSSNMTSELANRDSEMERMKEKVAALEIDNAMLVGQLKELVTATRRLQAQYEAAREDAARQEEEREDAMRAEAAELPAAPDGGVGPSTNAVPRSAPVLINSAGYNRPVQLRVPVAP